VTLIGKTSKNDKIQNNVNHCLLWLNKYFENPNLIENDAMPNICIASENGKIPLLRKQHVVQAFSYN
jgi:hypothetical protein